MRWSSFYRRQNEHERDGQNPDAQELDAMLYLRVAGVAACVRPAIRARRAVDFRPGSRQRKIVLECRAAVSDLGRGLRGGWNDTVVGHPGHRCCPGVDDCPGTRLTFIPNPRQLIAA